MIDRITGKLLEKTSGRVVVQAGGLGLVLQTPLSTFLSLPAPPAEVTLLVRLIIREESWDLFGFLTPLERESFDILTSVSRVGPKLALTIISAMEPAELGRALMAQDLPRLAAIKGIGTKTAERLIVELKDKAPRLSGLSSWPEGTPTAATQPTGREEAVMALINLGYTRTEAEKAVRLAIAGQGPEPDLGTIVKEALKHLSS
ncbi:MAG: Holliday junction branch migration protein RuvA [Deltaproteobacteria bacterium]|nr:Holliday junction branch migration protein RuvA [Deltaproteobacteria bacterium]